VKKETRTYADRREYNMLHVAMRRRKLRTMAIQHAGGKCIKCGYNKYPEVLEFHHRDSKQKLFGIGQRGLTRSWERIKNEIEKCDLLCANCHRELHTDLDKFNALNKTTRL
jgi:hypothetical protein